MNIYGDILPMVSAVPLRAAINKLDHCYSCGEQL